MDCFKTLWQAFVMGVVLIAMQACKKDNQAPTLTIAKPFNYQVISTNDSVLITGVIADEKDLHELNVTVTNAMGDTVMNKWPYVHGLQNKTYEVYFAPTDTGTYLATVTVLDHDLAYTQQTVILVARNAPTINLLLPIDSSAIPVNGQLQVKGTISDGEALLYLSLTSVNVRSGDTANAVTILLNNATTYSFDQFLPQPTKDTFNLTVTAVNHYNFAATKRVRYFVY